MDRGAALSDQDLLLRASDGDRRALSDLVSRHQAGTVSAAELTRAEELVDALVRHEAALPFRAAWAAGGAEVAVPAMDPICSAYAGLPSSWKLALWHREVEGHSLARIAHHLGMTDGEALRAVVSARSALKRVLALTIPVAAATAECEEIVSTYRFMPPASLDRAHARQLREHGRHCDDCLPLVRRLLVADAMLREHLAHAVLGSAADAYLAERPRPQRLPRRVPAAGSPGRRVPLRQLGVSGLGAAAVVGAMAITPSLVGSSSSPSMADEAPALVAPQSLAGAGRVLSPTSLASPRSVDDRSIQVSPRDDGAVGTGKDSSAGGAPSAGVLPVAVGGDDVDVDGTEEEPPAEETPVVEGPSTAGLPVKVKSDQDSVTVTVTPNDPLPEVEVTIKNLEDLPAATDLTGVLGK